MGRVKCGAEASRERGTMMINRQYGGSFGDEFVSLREAMDRLVADSFTGGPFRGPMAGNGNGAGSAGRAALPLDVYATDEAVVIIAAIPGLGPEDIEISVNQNTVTIGGQLPNVAASEAGTGGTWYLHELGHGAFRRSVSLPIDVDSSRADATVENGVLHLVLPRVEATRARQITIRSASRSLAGSEAGHLAATALPPAVGAGSSGETPDDDASPGPALPSSPTA